jgi:TM2 domain-containing membrane protein YozV/RNA polymerase subunit RPABC4/transcription elongation factor Spt4
MFCRNCAKEVHPNAVACPACGVPPLAESKHCQSCGTATQANQVMCTQCGVALLARSSSAVNSRKIAAGVLAILLNCLGIHKFYLGYATEGVVMLLVSIIGGFVACGIPTLVMSVIGIIEGVLYLVKSDQEFEDTYIRGRRGWF